MTLDPTEPRPPRRRRWLRRVLFAALVLLIVVIAVIQAVLMTNIPRQIVISQVQRQLGLRMSARTVDTGWFGRTTLRDVAFALPLSEQSFVDVPEVRVNHTNLVPLLIGRPLDLKRLEIDSPVVEVRQDASGMWNLQRVIELVTRPRGTPDPTATKRPPSLPEIDVSNATVRLIDNQGHTTTINPAIVKGWRSGPLVYEYSLDVESKKVFLVGQLSPGSEWEHQLRFGARQIETLIGPLVPALPPDISADGSWTGRVVGDGVSGRLDLTTLTGAGFTAKGIARVTVAGDTVEANPDGLTIQTPAEQAGTLRVLAGSITASPEAVRAEELIIEAHDGQAVVNGSWTRADNSAALTAAWNEIAFPAGFSQTGNINATLQTPWPGQPRITANITAVAAAESGTANTSIALVGEGQSFQSIDWKGLVNTLSWSGKQPVTLNQVSIAARTRQKDLHIDQLSLADFPTFSGRGQINLETLNWWVWSQAEALPLPEDVEGALAYNINAWGQGPYLNVERFYARAGDAVLSGQGFYDSKLPKPINAELYLVHMTGGAANAESSLVQGDLLGDLRLAGTVTPLNIGLEGTLQARDLHLMDRDLGHVQIAVTGSADQAGAAVRTQELELLGARWQLNGAWQRQTGAPAWVRVNFTKLPLAEVAQLAKAPPMTGTIDGNATIQIPALRLSRVSASAQFTGQDIVLSEPVRAQQMTASVSFRDKVLRVEPVRFEQDNGTASATISLSTDRPALMQITASASDWPTEYRQAYARTTAQLNMQLDLANQTAAGPLQINSRLSAQGRQVGTLSLEGSVDQTTLYATNIDARILNGTARGTARVNWREPLQTLVDLGWQDVQVAAIAAWVPRMEQLSGLSSGELRIGPAQDRHALGPVRVDFSQRMSDGQYNGMRIGNAGGILYLDRDRAVTENVTFNLADGTVSLFAKASQRPGAISMLVNVGYESLDLNQIVHAAKPDADPMIGRAAGRFDFGGDPRKPREMFGDGELHLTQSELGNFDPVGVLYNAVRFGMDANEPIGTADVQLRLDGDTLAIPQARIFNRGLEILANGEIRRIWEMPSSELDMTGVGSAKPLANIKLPFLADADKIFSVLQSNLTTVVVKGTVENPQPALAAFASIGEGLRKLVVGGVKGE